MTRYAKRKLKYPFSENFNLPPYVEWDRFVSLTGAQAEWGLRYRIYHNTSSVLAMLNHLQLPTLEHRRNLNRITMLYKITNNLIAVDPKLYLTPQPSLSTETIAHYNIKLYPPGQTIINTIFPHMQYHSGTHYLIQLLMLGPWIS